MLGKPHIAKLNEFIDPDDNELTSSRVHETVLAILMRHKSQWITIIRSHTNCKFDNLVRSTSTELTDKSLQGGSWGLSNFQISTRNEELLPHVMICFEIWFPGVLYQTSSYDVHMKHYQLTKCCCPPPPLATFAEGNTHSWLKAWWNNCLEEIELVKLWIGGHQQTNYPESELLHIIWIEIGRCEKFNYLAMRLIAYYFHFSKANSGWQVKGQCTAERLSIHLKDVLDRFWLTDRHLLGVILDNAGSNFSLTWGIQLILEASGIESPALSNHIPWRLHVIQLASGTYMSSLGANNHTKYWEAHERDQQCGENESIDIRKSQRLRKEDNATIDNVSAMSPAFPKITEKVHIST